MSLFTRHHPGDPMTADGGLGEASSARGPVGGMHPDTDFTGTAGNDHFTGTADDDNFDMSQGGNDTVKGLAGDDYIYMGAALTAADKLDGGDDYDVLELNGDYSGGLKLAATTLQNIEEVDLDSGHNYFLTLNNGNVAAGALLSFYPGDFTSTDSFHIDGSAVKADLNLRGDAGNDILIGGDGNDFLRSNGGTDVIDGGGGYNRISYFNATSGLTLDLNQEGHAQNTGLGTLTLSNVEDVSGTASADTITGDDHDNFIGGNGGADKLTGNGGKDWIDLGPDSSGNISTGISISGGSGEDLVTFYDNGLNTAGVTVDLSKSGAQVTGQGTVTMSSIEDAGGTTFDDHLTGTKGDNILYGNGGNDMLDGGTGNDKLYGDAYVFEGDPTGTDGPKTLFNDMPQGNDILIGGAGHDTMTGNGGNDIFYFEAGSGKDKITDFTVGADKIQIDVKGVKGFSDLTIKRDGHGGADVSWKGGALVDLQHVAPNSLSKTDFTFGKLSGASPAGTHTELAALPHQPWEHLVVGHGPLA